MGYAVDIATGPATGGRYDVTLSNQIGQGTIRYTVDGGNVDAHTQPYGHPFAVAEGTVIHAAAFDRDGMQLAPATTRTLSADEVATRTGTRLGACEGGRLSVRVPATPDATAAPYLTIDRTRDCVMYPAAALTGTQQLSVRMVPITHFFNTPLDGDPQAPALDADAPRHAVSIWLDRCAGKPLATHRLPHHPKPGEAMDLLLSLPAQGTHDLCVAVPQGKETFYYAFEKLSVTDGTGNASSK